MIGITCINVHSTFLHVAMELSYFLHIGIVICQS